MTLDQLANGDEATVRALAGKGLERRRLMDLGVLPGARIRAVFTSPFGDPTAYLVHGSLVALRRDQASTIRVDGSAKRE